MFLEHWHCRYRYFVCKVNTCNVNCAQATEWIFHSGVDVLGEVSQFSRQKVIWLYSPAFNSFTRQNFGEALIKTQHFSFTKMHLKMSSVKWRPFRPGPVNIFSTQHSWIASAVVYGRHTPELMRGISNHSMQYSMYRFSKLISLKHFI